MDIANELILLQDELNTLDERRARIIDRKEEIRIIIRELTLIPDFQITYSTVPTWNFISLLHKDVAEYIVSIAGDVIKYVEGMWCRWSEKEGRWIRSTPFMTPIFVKIVKDTLSPVRDELTVLVASAPDGALKELYKIKLNGIINVIQKMANDFYAGSVTRNISRLLACNLDAIQ